MTTMNEHQNYINGHVVSHEANVNGSVRSDTPATVVHVDDEHSEQEQQLQFTG